MRTLIHMRVPYHRRIMGLFVKSFVAGQTYVLSSLSTLIWMWIKTLRPQCLRKEMRIYPCLGDNWSWTITHTLLTLVTKMWQVHRTIASGNLPRFRIASPQSSSPVCGSKWWNQKLGSFEKILSCTLVGLIWQIWNCNPPSVDDLATYQCLLFSVSRSICHFGYA